MQEIIQEEVGNNSKFLDEIERLMDAGRLNDAIGKCDILIDALKEGDPSVQHPDHLLGYILKANILVRGQQPQNCLNICKFLLPIHMDHPKLLTLKYVSLLQLQVQRENVTAELEETFQKLTEKDKTEWVLLADYLRTKHTLSVDAARNKLREICDTFKNSRVALYLYSYTFCRFTNIQEYSELRPVNKDLYVGMDAKLLQKALRTAVLQHDYSRIRAIAEYYLPRFLAKIRTKTNPDQFFQPLDNEKEKILALLCASEVKNYLDEAIVYCKNIYLEKDIETQIFRCIALATQRPIRKWEANEAYLTLVKKFPENIFVLSMQPLLDDLMRPREIPTVDFKAPFKAKLAELEAKLEALDEDADPKIRIKIEQEIKQCKVALSTYPADEPAEPAEDKKDGWSTFKKLFGQ
ncbi:MAG: hypothetical protein M3R00_10280 [Pseudomonadota bacterium]|nr:hypothetical protein [Pseudomonadota bacterium]